MARPGAGEVHVWVARPSAVSAATEERCRSVLSADDTAHVARFRFERHRREALVTRALARIVLSGYLEQAPEELRFGHGPHGKPLLEPAYGLAFNVTNHPRLVACAVSALPSHDALGIDVEPLARGAEILAVADTVFSRAELASLMALPMADRLDRAVSLWTCKEAYIKALGLGFSAALQEITVDFPGGAPELRAREMTSPAERWWLGMQDIFEFPGADAGAPQFRLAVALPTERDVSLTIREAFADDAGV